LEKQNRWNRPFRASFRDNRTRPKQAQPTKTVRGFQHSSNPTRQRRYINPRVISSQRLSSSRRPDPRRLALRRKQIGEGDLPTSFRYPDPRVPWFF
jgi:hypothetical protein